MTPLHTEQEAGGLSPWTEGFRACRQGDTIHTNPYAPYTTEHARWQDGWHDYDAHQNMKEEALESIGWNSRAPTSRVGNDKA